MKDASAAPPTRGKNPALHVISAPALPEAADRLHLRGVFPEELVARFGGLGLDLGGPRRIVSAAWRGHFPRVRGVRARALAAVREVASDAGLDSAGEARARDGFVRSLWRCPDGALVESVRIPLGLVRNLAAWEMTEQFLRTREAAPGPVTGAVFMGMGEPFHNYEPVIRAARLLCAPWAGAVTGRNITVSTVGLTPLVRRYTREGWPFRLSVSLHSAIPEKRAALVPVERRWPLAGLVEAIREHAAARRERVNVAYVMMAGVNVGEEDARALGRLLAGTPVRLNLIDVADRSGRFRAPDELERKAFRDALCAHLPGVPAVRRHSGGAEIDGGCGVAAARPAPAPAA